MSTQPTPIVIGYDGSPGSIAALKWAAAAADRAMAPLQIVEAFEIVILTRPSPGKVVPLEAVRASRQKGLDEVAAGVREQHPGLRVETSLVGGSAAKTLVDAARDARLVVLGSRGLGGWSGLLVGSVAVQVTAHADCPVVVIPHDEQPHGDAGPTVIVGVDGSKASAKAIDFAFDQAESLHAQVVAIHAWTSPFLTYADGASMLQFDEEQIREESRLLVAESVAGAAADHPDVKWTTELALGSAAEALVRRSASAELVVVGSRGRGGFSGLVLGSVSQSVLHHVHSPIAVVH
ncbi:nucleotide-binding universal stress UspA family protein [Kribbella rubisoli]|uniref:Nucleotide-binding universal stress UspA family protein n=1 Tax=Kribbella rubisoli TaxID=3075929 RepID=A0A4Q7WNK4_9ACTN|nr:universal stress protein [Kribbella rubisoli]RZU11293.1 nucleotide-binding universal stress UspA family protein [Kribbella rubisoli]